MCGPLIDYYSLVDGPMLISIWTAPMISASYAYILKKEKDTKFIGSIEVGVNLKGLGKESG